MYATKMYTIGITGGICSGKSAATKVISSMGATVLDADKLGHQSYEKGTKCYTKLIEAFGTKIIDESNQEIDRRALGSIVFSDKTEMEKLQSIVWPEIKSLIKAEIDRIRSESGSAVIVAVEAAVMIEAGWQDLMDTVWVFSVDPEIAIDRLMARNGLTKDDAEKRVKAQLSNADRCAFADRVIENNFTDTETGLSDLEAAVRSAYESDLRIITGDS